MQAASYGGAPGLGCRAAVRERPAGPLPQEGHRDRDRDEDDRPAAPARMARAAHAAGARSRTRSAAGRMSCIRATDSPA